MIMIMIMMISPSCRPSISRLPPGCPPSPILVKCPQQASIDDVFIVHTASAQGKARVIVSDSVLNQSNPERLTRWSSSHCLLDMAILSSARSPRGTRPADNVSVLVPMHLISTRTLAEVTHVPIVQPELVRQKRFQADDPRLILEFEEEEGQPVVECWGECVVIDEL
jgi:hypothetical protein